MSKKHPLRLRSAATRASTTRMSPCANLTRRGDQCSALAVSEASKRTMKKFSLFSVSVTTLALVGPAVGQYVPPPPGVWVNPNPAPGTMPPGYKWREQRPYEDPRRNSNIPQDRQPRENYETPSTLNNATGRGAVTDPGECAIGVSEETCRRRGQKYNPPKN